MFEAVELVHLSSIGGDAGSVAGARLGLGRDPSKTDDSRPPFSATMVTCIRLTAPRCASMSWRVPKKAPAATHADAAEKNEYSLF